MPVFNKKRENYIKHHYLIVNMEEKLYINCECSKGTFSDEYMVSFHTDDGAEKFCFVPKESVIVEERPSALKHPKGLVRIALKELAHEKATVRVMGSEVKDYTIYANSIKIR